MHASSLVFVVIIAIWATYLLPDHLRRRRRLESARTEDRNSAQMRVLVRRGPEEAVAQGAAPTAAPAELPAASVRPVLGAAPARAGEQVPAAEQVPEPRVPVETVPVAAAVPAPRTPLDPGGPVQDGAAGRGSGARAQRVSRVVRRRRRLVGVLAASSAAGWFLPVVSQVPWPVALAPTVLLLLVLAALARHAAGTANAAQGVRPGVRLPVAEPVVDAAAAVVRGELVPDPGAAPAPAGRSAAQPSARRPVEGEWQPVPVPLPTYLLKPKAPPAPVPAASRRRVVLDVRPFDQDVVTDLREDRRVATG